MRERMASASVSPRGHAHSSSLPITGYSAESNLLVHRQHHNSSKLPSFRFADLKKEFSLRGMGSKSKETPTTAATTAGSEDQLQAQHAEATKPAYFRVQSSAAQRADQRIEAAPQPVTQDLMEQRPLDVVKPAETSRPAIAASQAIPLSASHTSPARTRAATFDQDQSPSRTATSNDGGTKRPASYPHLSESDATAVPPLAPTETTRDDKQDLQRHTVAVADTTVENRRAQPPYYPPARADEVVPSADGDDEVGKDSATGQRQLLLPKALQAQATGLDERRKARPPVSYRPPITPITPTAGGRAVIPPIRSFRASVTRKSLILDMNARTFRFGDEGGEEDDDVNQRDRTLRALVGADGEDTLRLTPPDSAAASPEKENTAELFLRLAQEDRPQPNPEGALPAEPSAVSRIVRSTHKRPLSAAVPFSQVTSPPQITRRLSDQREETRSRVSSATQQPYRALAYRDRLQLNTTATEDASRSRTSASLRPSPITPRGSGSQEGVDGLSAYARRRTSITESNSGLSGRKPPYKQSNLSYNPARSLYSSPLAPRAGEASRTELFPSNDGVHGVEGTESSASTAAASTVWDELDDLKSRIHRLELTGKMPQTSGAAMSRAAEERPPTATTTGTTISISPKRNATSNINDPETTVSATSQQRETSGILMSALEKSKELLRPEVYGTIEAAAKDALSLSSLMGTVGQPGPISSGTSTIGGTSLPVTDRQLRRKAESVCRSLTELCLALNEEAGNAAQKAAASARERQPAVSPTTTKFSGLAAQRRQSLQRDQAPSIAGTPPARAVTRTDDRRSSLVRAGVTATSSPRYAVAPSTPAEPAIASGRRSSLLLARSRRATTEEPEETGRRSSLLRTRRAETEEPEPQSGRRSSLLIRRRGDVAGDADDDAHVRVPSRAATEIGVARTAMRSTREPPVPPMPDMSSLNTSALPRRRPLPNANTSRLITAPGSSPLTLSSLTNSPKSVIASRETSQAQDDKPQRQLSLSQTAMLNRTSSLNRRNRQSLIPGSATSQAGLGR